MKKLICLVLVLVLVLSGCSKPGVSEALSTGSESSPETLQPETDGSIEPENSFDPEAALNEFSDSMLLGPYWENPEEISVDDLVMWYGYKILALEETVPGTAEKYIRDDLDGLYIPAEEFEEAVFDHFGLGPALLEESQCFSPEYSCFVTPTALYDLCSFGLSVSDTSFEGGIYRISFEISFEDGERRPGVLSVTEEEDGSLRFLSYLPAGE